MAKFEVTWRESYEHKVIVDANSYLEAEEKADQLLSQTPSAYSKPIADWDLLTNRMITGEKKSRKEQCIAA